MITEKVKKTILYHNLIEKGEHIVIGLSGGPDSVCLFYLLKGLSEELENSLHVVHINHKIRPGAAEEDQAYVESLCRRFDIPCHSFVYDINQISKKEGISSEDAGRRARYESFYRVAESIQKEHGATVKIAVAQNMNDQAETLLMRIMRGTGTDGLSGIEYQRPGESGTVIIRPLLDVTRQEIEEFCQTNQLNPRIDLTNLEPIYTRNKIRLELLPYMKENFNTSILDSLNRLSKIAKEDKSYFSQIVEDEILSYGVQQGDQVRMPLDRLLNQHSAVRHRMILRIFESIGLEKDISSVHLEQADQLLRSRRTSSSVNFSSGYIMRLSYDAVEFLKKAEAETTSFEYEVNLSGITDICELNGEIGVKILERKDWMEKSSKQDILNDCNLSGQSKFSCFMSFDKINSSGAKLVLRSRKQGDYFRPFGMKGSKKLQDFFVDSKVRKEERDRIPLICLGSEVLWVAGSGRISENYKVDSDTKQIIVLEYNLKT